MKHFLVKNSLTIKGAGGGQSTPPPPVVTQYPAVLAPPSYSDFNSINSFSYAEMIDLLADGPIEGLINKNGRKVYDENIFEGIYLNDTPVKETSSIESQLIPINFLNAGLQALWYPEDVLAAKLQNLVPGSLEWLAANTKITYGPVSTATSSGETSKSKSLILDYRKNTDIPDRNFTSNITLTYYPPEESVAKFVSLMGGDVNSSLLIEKTFDLSPFATERPFLTTITIPKFNIYLDPNKFDSSEGGSNVDSPLGIGILNLSEHFYYSVGYDSLNLFNYFELPRSFAVNSIVTPSSKKTFSKTKIENSLFLQYEVYDVKILIWSIYDLELDKPKDFKIELNKYFNNLTIFQNKKSLYNYNLIESEFRNGSEIQSPLLGFSKTEMDIEYNKELVGPFRVTNNFATSTAFQGGGVQRICSLVLCANNPPFVNLSLEEETSDDIRFAKSWPVEYTADGKPYVVCNYRANYAQFDKTSTLRVAQDAVPLTHYVSNQNTEEVYVTLNISQLSDTNHIELVCSAGAVGNKYCQTENPPKGMNKYGNPPGVCSIVSSNVCTNYLLLHGDTFANSKIIAGHSTMSCLFTSLCKTIMSNSENNINALAERCWSSEGLSSSLYTNSVTNGVNTSPFVISAFSEDPDAVFQRTYPTIFTNTLLLYNNSALNNYMVPNLSSFFTPTVPIKGYLYDQYSFENKIKAKNNLGNFIYEFAIEDSSRIKKENDCCRK